MSSIKFILITFFITTTVLLLLDFATAGPAEEPKLQSLMKRVKREEEEVDLELRDEKGHRVYCINTVPCAWEIYQRYTRLKDFTFNNTCRCEPKKICARDEDDVSIHAYVHRCKLRSSFTERELAIILAPPATPYS